MNQDIYDMVSLYLSALLIFASMCGVKPFLSKENSIDDRSQTNSAQPVKYSLQSAPSVSVEDGERTFRSSMEDFSFKKNSQITDVVASGFLGLKFEATATATGNRNKGRISIDDLVFGMSSDTYYNNYWITNYPKTSH